LGVILLHQWNRTKIGHFRKYLLRWYHKNRRDLPWRINPTPYRVWISEIMLQQTQVKTVIPYFNRFMKQFPSLEDLAGASEHEVLELWAGLGYYKRARNLHKAARQIVETHGTFPDSFKDILALPGVGRYTAGAICSIALNQAKPIVDGNIRRILVRLGGSQTEFHDRHYWNQISGLLPKEDPSFFNQAMMELGALICIPLQPRCMQCPVKGFCRARTLGIQDRIPMVRRKIETKHLSIVTLVLTQNRKLLLKSLDDFPLIPGEWGLPCQMAARRESASRIASTLCRKILGQAVPLSPMAPIRHSITHHRISVHGFHGNPGLSILRLKGHRYVRWVNLETCETVLTSSLFHKVIQKYRREY
jgi:A/G-specific adenine glycosylase